MCRQRRLLWRRLAKVKKQIKYASTIQKLSKLIHDRWDLESQLRDDYTASNRMEEDKAVFNMKRNPKAFFSFAHSRQKNRAKVGPFVDPATGKPNSSPDLLLKHSDSSITQPLINQDHNGKFKIQWHTLLQQIALQLLKISSLHLKISKKPVLS